MSNTNTGMEFKKFTSDKRNSLFSGMKIKQQAVAHTLSNFSFTQKSHQQIKPISSAVDININSASVERQQKFKQSVTNPTFIKPIEQNTLKVDLSIKYQNRNSQSSQNKTVEESKQKQIGKIKDEIVVERSSNKLEIRNQGKAEIENSNERPHTQGPITPQRNKSERPSTIAKIKGRIGVDKKNIEQQKAKKTDREQALDEINDYNIKLTSIIFKQRQIQDNICKYRESINDLSKKITHWVTEQALCAERQEYDVAEKLQTDIQESQKTISGLQIQLNFGEQQLIKKQNEEISLLKTQSSNLKRISRRLKLIYLQLQDDAANIKRQQQQKIEQLKNKQQVERIKVQSIEKDISHHKQQIIGLEKVLKQELEGKINPLIQEKQILEEDKVKLLIEIKELQKQLKEKTTELTKKSQKLEGVNKGINEINQSFKQQKSRLQERKQQLQNMENAKVQMQNDINTMEISIESQTKSMDAKVYKKIIEATELAQMTQSLQQKLTNFDDQIDLRKVAFENFLINGKILKEFQSKHKEKREKVKQLQSQKNNIASEISKLQEKQTYLKMKIPSLQSDQKKFADQKNYKAATLKKTEIKQLNDEIIQIKKKIENYFFQEYLLQMQLQDMIQSQKESNEEQASLKYNLARSQHRHYAEKANKIKKYKQEIERACNMNEKLKQKLLTQLIQQYLRYNEQLLQLNTTYDLGIKQSQQQLQELEETGVLKEGQNEEDEYLIEQYQYSVTVQEDNNQLKQDQEIYQPPNLQQNERKIEEDAGGYVSLQLD